MSKQTLNARQDQELALVEFVLYDQFGNEYNYQEYRNQFLIVIGADKKGSQYSNEWGSAIARELRSDSAYLDIPVIGVAHLQAVPEFLHKYVKSLFPEDRNSAVLLDWEGIFAKTYPFTDDVANIWVFSPDGYLIFCGVGKEVSRDQIITIKRRIDDIRKIGSIH